MDRYTHGVVGDDRAALDRLPDLSVPPAAAARAARATGTAGPEPDAARLALCLARPGGKGRTLAHSGAPREPDTLIPESGENPRKTAVSRRKAVVRLAGLEPATFGLEGRCSLRLSYRRPGSQALSTDVSL